MTDSKDKSQGSSPATISALRRSREQVLRDVTVRFIAKLDKSAPISSEKLEAALMAELFAAIDSHNESAKNAGLSDIWQMPQFMEPVMCALILARDIRFVRLDFSDGEEQDVQAFPLYRYDESEGIYLEVEPDDLGGLVRQYRFTATTNYITEVMACLREMSPIVRRTRDANLDACKSGIRRRDTGEVLEFSPEYVFTTKAAVDYNPNATNVHIKADDGYVWDIESAILEFANGDADVARLLWQVIAATLRPNVRWDKSVWFYSTSGNNGKGTLCQLIRNLVGAGNHTSIPFADFNNAHFMLGPLTRVQAVICDENQVGKYADDNAEFKAAVTNDVFRIDRKHKPPLTARFHGTIIQCVNEVPRIRDRSDSFWRRICVIPFDECFTGRERPEIKHDYICRTDVLEYVYKRAIEMDFDEFDVPDSCSLVLEEFKQESSPVLQFALDVLPQATWDLLPWTFLWDLYKRWYSEVYNRNGAGFGRNHFLSEICSVVDTHPDLGFSHSRKVGKTSQESRWSSQSMIAGVPEPLISAYQLYDVPEWAPANKYRGDAIRQNVPNQLKDYYRGLVRTSYVKGAAASKPGDDKADVIDVKDVSDE